MSESFNETGSKLAEPESGALGSGEHELDSVESETEANPHVDVCYVVPPVLSKGIPAFGVSILKSCLARAGFTCRVDYANHRFADAMGSSLHDFYQGGLLEPLVEYVFNGPAGIDSGFSPAEAVESYIKMRLDADLMGDDEAEVREFRERALAAVEKGIAVAAAQTEATARRVLALDPKVVGCTSTFAQRNASLGVLRRIKELDPSVITMMGGYNMTGPAGLATLRQFGFVDCVLFGESDDIVAEVVGKLLSGDTSDMPYGAAVNADELPPMAPHRILEDMDATPVPDYDEYMELFEAAHGSAEPGTGGARLALPTETSRGCWWGQKSPCRFCGVCGKSRTYRVKSPEKVVEHMLAINERYGVTWFDFCDPILPQKQAGELISRIADCGKDFHLSGMIKANISRDQLENMARAGWVKVLPGIESLSDTFLKRIGKGLRASQCVALLKNATRLGVYVAWNLLYAAPDETDGEYEEQLELIPKLAHLNAPTGAFHILYARDSYYELNRDEYGLDLAPLEATRLYCPQDEDYVRDVAGYYRDVNELPPTPRRKQLRRQLVNACAEWGEGFKSRKRRLDMARLGDDLMIFDSRHCRTSVMHTLQGLETRIYELADQPVTREALLAGLEDASSESQVDEAIQGLLDRNLMVRVSGCYIALALPMDATSFMLRYLINQRP